MGLIDLLPDYYKKSPQVINLQDAFEHWTSAMQSDKNDLLAQLNVESATWGLEIWEKALGVVTDVSKPYEYRRTRIMSKLRGAGTTTKQMIKNVAESFSNGIVDIIEDNLGHIFKIKFVGTIGVPPNMDDLEAAVETIKPAHLAAIYEFIYATWANVASRTWGEVSGTTWDQLRNNEVI